MIYFHLSEYCGPTNAYYQLLAICLAQGLRKLGVPFSANIDYWYEPERCGFLFQRSEDSSAPYHVWEHSYVQNVDLASVIDTRKKNILLDSVDGKEGFCLKQESALFNVIFRTHYTRGFRYPSNVLPACFYVPEHLQDALERTTTEERIAKIWINTRIAHQVREFANQKFFSNLPSWMPVDTVQTQKLDDTENLGNGDDIHHHYWAHTGRRFDMTYYSLLNSYVAASCFGGYFHRQDGMWASLKEKVLNNLGFDFKGMVVMYQWDSYRLAETMMSQACPVMVDLSAFGMLMPEMPIHGRHYVGPNTLQFSKYARKWQYKPSDLVEIGAEGRAWALQHLTGLSFANYVLKTIGF